MPGPVDFNPLKLNSKPEPTKPWEVVFARDCPNGDPREVSDHMLCRTKSEFQLLGRMYDKQCVQRLDTGSTPVFFGTQQSYLNMLRDRGLVELIANQRNRYQLTYLGMRVYELNYWLDQWKRQGRQQKILDEAKSRALSNAREGWVNPKPDTEPDAIPPSAIPTDEPSSDEAAALPPGVYPAL
jgi:hypothetical protein